MDFVLYVLSVAAGITIGTVVGYHTWRSIRRGGVMAPKLFRWFA